MALERSATKVPLLKVIPPKLRVPKVPAARPGLMVPPVTVTLPVAKPVPPRVALVATLIELEPVAEPVEFVSSNRPLVTVVVPL